MLDLSLALVWTPLGIGALIAAAAAVACAAYLPRLAVPIACLALVLAGVAYVSALQADLTTARRERNEARTAAAAATAGTKAVEGVAGKAAARAKASRATRDRIP